MRIPRDLSRSDLARALSSLGYAVTRQSGRTTQQGEHHPSLRLGTLSAILADVADHFGVSRSDLVEQLFVGKS